MIGAPLRFLHLLGPEDERRGRHRIGRRYVRRDFDGVGIGDHPHHHPLPDCRLGRLREIRHLALEDPALVFHVPRCHELRVGLAAKEGVQTVVGILPDQLEVAVPVVAVREGTTGPAP